MPTLSPAGPRALPSSDDVRRAALARSWSRDRRVGRRRLVWRWTLWLLWRYGLPVGAVALVIAAAAWLWLRPAGPATAPQADTPRTPAADAPAAPPRPDPAAAPRCAAAGHRPRPVPHLTPATNPQEP